jgi:hypothetical protein
MMFTLATASTLILANSARADDAAEKKKIEALIKHIEDQKDARFVRNGRENDAKTWAGYMKVKWRRAESEVKTAKDFIEQCASKSEVSGKPYMIKFKDGKEQKMGEYLTAALKKIEEKKPDDKKPEEKKDEKK